MHVHVLTNTICHTSYNACIWNKTREKQENYASWLL